MNRIQALETIMNDDRSHDDYRINEQEYDRAMEMILGGRL